MGMTIDEATKVLSQSVVVIGAENWQDARHLALDTMRKYQKIEELYDYWRSGKCEYTISCMENIGKVLKDGKID